MINIIIKSDHNLHKNAPGCTIFQILLPPTTQGGVAFIISLFLYENNVVFFFKISLKSYPKTIKSGKKYSPKDIKLHRFF